MVKNKIGCKKMNNTALRAELQSSNNIHMVFLNVVYEKLYYEGFGAGGLSGLLSKGADVKCYWDS